MNRTLKPLAPRAGLLPVLFVSVLFVALATLGLPGQILGQDLDLSGKWVLTVESPNGTGQRDLTLVQEGNTLTGEIMSSRAGGDLEGTVEGDQVTFIAIVYMGDRAFDITYTGTVIDGEMKGSVDFGDYGSGTFTGKRVES